MSFLKKVKYHIVLNIALCFLIGCNSAASQLSFSDWHRFMLGQDLIVDSLTNQWSDGLFTGNGLIGNMVYMEGLSSLRIDVGRTDVFEHRNDSSISPLFTKSRLPIGHFLLTPKGKIKKNMARLDLWNAEIRGTIVTDKGSIEWRTLTLSEQNVIVFSYKTSGDEKKIDWKWIPDESISTRYYFKGAPNKKFVANPNGSFQNGENSVSYLQPMIAGGAYATTWVKGNDNYLISIGYNQVSGQDAIRQTFNVISPLKNENAIKMAIDKHQKWWHNYYNQSFLSIPDKRMESFYWIQMYKIASGTRGDKPALDLQGPWTAKTPWPAYWFNLNLQLEYSPLYTSNHLEIAKSLINLIDQNAVHLYLNVPKQYQNNSIAIGRAGGYDMVAPIKVSTSSDSIGEGSLELGNLNWLLFYYWLHYEYSNDSSLKEKLTTLLTKSTNYFLNVMTKGYDGKYHLPYSYSPEYPNGTTRDCNYSLALFRWSCETLLKLAPESKNAVQWKDVLLNLVDYPQDSTGLRIGKDVGFTTSHRHYSHLLMIYPLQLMNWEQIQNKELIQKSIDTWHKDKRALQGYSFTGGASMYEMMNNGDKAYELLNTLLSKYVKSNTMYLEKGPVIETPLAAASTIQEMLLQSRNGKLFLFHGVPSKWKHAVFSDFLSPGGVLVSAIMENGKTVKIKLESKLSRKITIVSKISSTPYLNLLRGDAQLIKKSEEEYEINLASNTICEIVDHRENEHSFDYKKAVASNDTYYLNYWGRKSSNYSDN